MAPAEWVSSHKCDKDEVEMENIWNFINSTWVTVGSIMQQGSDILPKYYIFYIYRNILY